MGRRQVLAERGAGVARLVWESLMLSLQEAMRRAGEICATLAAKNVVVQKIVAKLALGIVGSAKLDEVGQFFIDGF